MRPLDGVRGMACMLVILSHIGRILGTMSAPAGAHLGGAGVVLFFVLSGFLMGVLYVHKPFSFPAAASYSIARFSRIAPAYWIAIAFVVMIFFFLPEFHYQMTAWNTLRAVFFGGNQGVFWSIPPEVQFYGFFLLLWFGFSAWREGRKIWLVLLVGLSLLFVATRAEWGGLMLPSKLHIFLCGFMASFLPRLHLVKNHIGRMPVQLALTALAFGYAVFAVTDKTLYTDLLLPVFFALWIASVSVSTRLTAPFETQMMTMMGAASFSIYLFHDPVLMLMRDLGLIVPEAALFNAAVMCLVSVALPVAFHFLAEKHLNGWARSGLNRKLSAFLEKRRTR